MSVAKIIEISSESRESSPEAALAEGLAEAVVSQTEPVFHATAGLR